jgi:hypothetical protein
MPGKTSSVALGLSLLAVVSADAGVIKGVMSVTGAEME